MKYLEKKTPYAKRPWSKNLGFVFFFLLIFFLSAVKAFSAIEITDETITLAVEQELIQDEVVSADAVDVETRNGIVTLSGVVTNILEEDRAVRIAESIKGVRAVISQVVVTPLEKRFDRSIERDIKNALLYNSATESFEVEVDVDDKVVILAGTVDSWQERQLVEKVSKGVKGVTDIRNNLVVRVEGTRPDTEIKQDIQSRLKWDVQIDEGLIDVQVEEGDVTLQGSVGSAFEKRRAYFDSWVRGVKTVDNEQLEVDWSLRDRMQRNMMAARTDMEIKQAVSDVLLYDPRVFSFNADVLVDDGVVTLSGTVETMDAKQAAKEDALQTVGVWRVRNYLKVRPGEEVDDRDIEKRINQAYERDPLIDQEDISLVVNNGEVNLYGTVESEYEQFVAEQHAYVTRGVIDVKNYTQITRPLEQGKSDWEIKQDIESQLFWSPFVDEDDIMVSVDNGVATLQGTVETWGERGSAIENAFEGGAEDVIVEITVNSPNPLNQ